MQFLAHNLNHRRQIANMAKSRITWMSGSLAMVCDYCGYYADDTVHSDLPNFDYHSSQECGSIRPIDKRLEEQQYAQYTGHRDGICDIDLPHHKAIKLVQLRLEFD